MKKLALLLVLVLTLCACAPATPVLDSNTTTKFTSQGYTLSVPNEYVDLLIIDTTPSDGDNRSTFFSVREKASVEAAKQLWPGDETAGGGFLFGIGRLDEAQFHEEMMWGMTGMEVFARDNNGSYYIHYHPTDVQLLRTGDYTQADWDLYSELCEWSTLTKQTFIADNPGLTPYERTYTDVDCALHQLAYGDGIAYLHYSRGDAIYTPARANSMPYLEQLLDDVLFHFQTDGTEPQGSYINLRLPDTLPFTTFDFFTDEGQQQFIRLNMEGADPLYLVASRDGKEFPAGQIVADWLGSLS